MNSRFIQGSIGMILLVLLSGFLLAQTTSIYTHPLFHFHFTVPAEAMIVDSTAIQNLSNTNVLHPFVTKELQSLEWPIGGIAILERNNGGLNGYRFTVQQVYESLHQIRTMSDYIDEKIQYGVQYRQPVTVTTIKSNKKGVRVVLLKNNRHHGYTTLFGTEKCYFSIIYNAEICNEENGVRDYMSIIRSLSLE